MYKKEFYRREIQILVTYIIKDYLKMNWLRCLWELIKLRHFTFLAFYYCSPTTIPQAWPCRYKTKWNVLMSNKCNLQNKYSQTKYRFRVVSKLRIWIAIWSEDFFQLNNFPRFFHGELKFYDKEKKVIPCKKRLFLFEVYYTTLYLIYLSLIPRYFVKLTNEAKKYFDI